VRLVSLQTACQNPTGRDLSPERRERLARMAVDRNFFIIEDGVYADLRYEGERQPALRKLAPGHTVYVSSLSKTIGGGLRIGWLAARGPVFERLAVMKLDADLHTTTLTQHIAAEFLASGAYDDQIAGSLDHYRERRDSLLASLERHLAGEYRVVGARGGHHIWATLLRPVDERALYTEALRHGVSFVPGSAVSVERPFETNLRLSFSLLDPAELDEGVKRLARAIREVRRRDRRSAVTVS
jgi:DNA-binding transcriptional MocR family regulator